jgi:pre-rRNA-processing protein TSR3
VVTPKGKSSFSATIGISKIDELKKSMSLLLPTIIWRHRKENLKKCSLKNLERRKDLLFLTYPKNHPPDLKDYIILTLDGPPLTEIDQTKGLFFIDATWKYSEIMKKELKKRENLEWRTLPNNYFSAYPRKQTGCSDPLRGLATVEALYLAYLITKKNTEGLLDYYHFKDEFLKINSLLN